MWGESEGRKDGMSCNSTLIVSMACHSDISVLTPLHSPAVRERERERDRLAITEHYMEVTCS